jgi:Reverse transcriptase (RNA-dependent DNA polymerase)
LDYYAEKLIKYRYAYENPTARYVSESLVIPKVKIPVNFEEDFRLVVNYKRVNAICEAIYWPMPTFEEIQRHLHGAKYFITLDAKNGYWQIGLNEESRELFSFATHRTVLTPYKMMQGSTDAVMYFTYLMMTTFKDLLYRGLIPWIDDLLLYSDTIDGLFDLLEKVLDISRDVGLKFSPKKLKLFAQEIKWVGKVSIWY